VALPAPVVFAAVAAGPISYANRTNRAVAPRAPQQVPTTTTAEVAESSAARLPTVRQVVRPMFAELPVVTRATPTAIGKATMVVRRTQALTRTTVALAITCARRTTAAFRASVSPTLTAAI